MTFNAELIGLLVVADAICAAMIGGYYLKFYQSNNYKLARFKELYRYTMRYLIIVLCFTVFKIIGVCTNIPLLAYAAQGAVLLLLTGVTFRLGKQNMTFTLRALRVLTLQIIIFFTVTSSFSFIGLTAIITASTVSVLLSPIYLIAALYLDTPIEWIIREEIIRIKVKKLNSFKDLTVIGITGSYGKTGVKNILNEMLSKQFNTVATPASYNTPLGICRAIDLIDSNTQYFIVEMGAKRTGDIAKICRMTHPKYGIITGIGAQHTATFINIDNIVKTKCELTRYVGADNSIVQLRHPYASKLKDCIGDGALFSDESFFTQIMSADSEGVTIKYSDEVGELVLRTKLIAKHNQNNIALAVKMARIAGVTDVNIVNAVFNLDYVSHRQQIINAGGGITIIDDSYNSNPESVKSALDTLSMFRGRKVIVSSGYIELNNENENINLGQSIGVSGDIVILVGSKAAAIQKGVEKVGAINKTIKLDSMNKVAEYFKKNLTNGDIVLLLNDLPENKF